MSREPQKHLRLRYTNSSLYMLACTSYPVNTLITVAYLYVFLKSFISFINTSFVMASRANKLILWTSSKIVLFNNKLKQYVYYSIIMVLKDFALLTYVALYLFPCHVNTRNWDYPKTSVAIHKAMLRFKIRLYEFWLNFKQEWERHIWHFNTKLWSKLGKNFYVSM